MNRLNITFHGIGEVPETVSGGEAAVWVDPDDFHAALDRLAPHERVRITFDDGNRSDVELALPALKDRGLVGRFFVVVDRIGETGYLDADDLRELAREGMTIGSHGVAHRPWRTVDDAALSDEVMRSRQVLESIVGRPVVEAACPFGSYDRRVLRAVRRAGYCRVYTSDGGWTHDAFWLQARNTLRAGTAAKTAAVLLRGPQPIASAADAVRQTAKRLR
jgi:peptidoglycan/xylan/chitin deacetylase (PgdA/CDA1 family)